MVVGTKEHDSGVLIKERQGICLPRYGTKDVLQRGDLGFSNALSRLYSSAENDALEGLVALKVKLRTISTDDFWAECTQGLSGLLGAAMTFIMKRMLVDEHGAAVEMPPIGEPGACLMAAAVHWCGNDGTEHALSNSKVYAYGCPCAYMRHDKVFIIPENLNDFITDNPNQLPQPADAYIAVPLFAENKCIAHFGVMWSKERAAALRLSWGFIEMLMHSLEDMITERLLEGQGLGKPSTSHAQQPVIPHDAVTVAQSLRPYVGSLSHELRTPMQGVVGMLDVMYATVHEAVENSSDPHLRMIFENLKENIEVVQDSSRRAVEAADNVVHAYDMDMSVPERPPNLPMDDSMENGIASASTPTVEKRPDILVAGHDLPIPMSNKRRRTEPSENGYSLQRKVPRVGRAASTGWSLDSEVSQELKAGVVEAEEVQARAARGADTAESTIAAEVEPVRTPPLDPGRITLPGLRNINIRDLLSSVITEGLKVGGRPDSAIATETDFGASLEVRSRGSNGTISKKTIDWSVDTKLPETMYVDEKDLSKLISCVFLNAIKFTDKHDGRIVVNARMSSRGRFIVISISDNGPGIPAAFLPKLFKPFSQHDRSLTRQSEGLGLGLMVAKGIARKLGGDLMCTRADTKGSNHGTEFEIKLPIMAGDIISRPTSPFASPVPRSAKLAPSETLLGPVDSNAPVSPRTKPSALHLAVSDTPMRNLHLAESPSPKSPVTSPLLSLPIHAARATSTTPPAPARPAEASNERPRLRKLNSNPKCDRDLASKYPLTFLVAEDNRINRKLLVNMLAKLGYRDVYEAHDGVEAVRQMSVQRDHVDVILMDLWMPLMDGYEATERILRMAGGGNGTCNGSKLPTVLAVTADVTDGALARAANVGMKGFMTKPYKMLDLQRLITEYCAQRTQTSAVVAAAAATPGIVLSNEVELAPATIEV